jgi:trimethylamine--corrinoid protein Co-methyltransferase
MTDATTQHAGTPPYDPLSQADARRILDASFQLMRETGVRFDPDPRIMDLFNDAGCDVAHDGLVKFDPELVRDSLASTARRVRLWNRPGTEFIEIANGNTWFSPGMTCIQVVDMETGEPRRSTREDLADITRVADALPDIDFVCVPCKIVERSHLLG